MFNITYNKLGNTESKSFEDYLDLVEFVAMEGIKDEDFIAMNLGEDSITGGISGLANYALGKVQKAREARAEMEAMLAAMESEEDLATA